MTEERLVLAELLEKAGEGDFLRAVAEGVLQLLMETDVEGLIGAGRYERNGERTTWRNGYRTARSTPGSARCSSAGFWGHRRGHCASNARGSAASRRRTSAGSSLSTPHGHRKSPASRGADRAVPGSSESSTRTSQPPRDRYAGRRSRVCRRCSPPRRLWPRPRRCGRPRAASDKWRPAIDTATRRRVGGRGTHGRARRSPCTVWTPATC